MSGTLSRRDLLTSATGVVAAATLPAGLLDPTKERKRVLRFAHLTDIHVHPSDVAPAGMEKALAAAQSLKDKPELIVTGGDQIMDSFAVDADRTKAQWDVWSRVMKANAELPLVHCIGNHDVWGWSSRSGATGNEPKFGKAWAVEALELKNRYYSFDRAGWHWIVLDSTDREGEGYKARLDDGQFEWLGDDLASNKGKHTIIVSHEPLFSAAAMLDGENEKTGDWVIPGAWTHIDFRRIKNLLHQNKQVKLAISGHLHMVERLDYLGVSYLCNGAVSGNWWGGDGYYHEFAPGFAAIDLYDDGTFDHEFHTYTWK